MAYGDYDGPDKPNKGKEGGSCNRTSCQDEPALWFNHGSYAWYCAGCRSAIEFDSFNKRNWDERWRPECGRPMFETREMMDARKSLPAPDRLVERLRKGPVSYQSRSGPIYSGPDVLHREAATALQCKDEQIERLTRERDIALENYTRAWNERDAQRRRAVAAEQQVQKLTAENERLRVTLMAARAVLQEDRDELFDSVTVAGNAATIDEIDRPHVDRMEAILSSIDAALEAQEGGK